MKVADFDFTLPDHLIASRPAERRDQARLLVLHRTGDIEHRRFSDITGYFNEGDLLLLNDTKVFPARLIARKDTGGKIDILLVKRCADGLIWEIMARGSYTGRVTIGDGVEAEIRDNVDSGDREAESGSAKKFLKFADVKAAEVDEIVSRYGLMPLPPYIRRLPDEQDRSRYQTVYAAQEGSIAAPTAGLHFTDELLEEIRNAGVTVRMLTLHVGPGTFRPVRSDHLEGHRMDPECFETDASVVAEIRRRRLSGKRLFTVGTTTTRAIEGFMSGLYRNGNGTKGADTCAVATGSETIRGHTDIFIYPGYGFKAVDGLITNFHLPRSTPLMLTSAFAGVKKLLAAYREAIAMGYRFFSYGDAMLIL